MAIQFQCSQCGVQFNVGAELAGTMARCNSCGNVVQVPAVAASPQKRMPPVVAAKPQIPVARIEGQVSASQSLPVSRIKLPQSPPRTAPGLKRPVYQLPSQARSSDGLSTGAWLAIGGGIA